MRRVLFARVADMKYYKGITNNDKPENGGSYVNDTGRAHECYKYYRNKHDLKSSTMHILAIKINYR